MASYKVVPWDNPKRWLVVKKEGKEELGYLVELEIFGTKQAWCSCPHFEFSKDRASRNIPHCKHVKLVQEHLDSFSKDVS